MAQSSKRSRHIQRKKVKKSSGTFFAYILLLGFFVLGITVFFRFKVIPKFFSIEETTNVLVVSHNDDFSQADIMYMHLDVQPEERKLFFFDPDEMVTVPGGYGEYPLKSVFPLLSLDIPKDQLISYFSSLFGVIFSDVVAIDRDTFESVAHTSKEKIFVKAIEDTLLTQNNLDAAKTMYHLQQLIIQESQDESRKKTYSVLQAPSLYTSLFTQSESQECSLAVLNATNFSGLARKITTILEQSGMYVIRVAAHNDIFEQSTLYIDPITADNCKKIVHATQKLFTQSLIIAEDQKVTQEHRAKIILFLGQEDGKVLSN